MILSMTGYGSVHQNFDNFDLSIEIKSVNNRYLNIYLKMADDLRFLEQPINTILAKYISRGKVECRVNINFDSSDSLLLTLNDNLANQLVKLNKRLTREANISSMSVGDLLKFPGIFVKNDLDSDFLQTTVLKQVEIACQEFNAARQREGENLKVFLIDRLNQIDEIVATIINKHPQRIEQYQQRLFEKLATSLNNLADEDRINQEIALYIQKIDIDEELARLKSHLEESRRILNQNNKTAVGKRLDFMMQEFNRESNTLSSKSNQAELTQYTIELKVLIEQMREQIQNIE